jgi:uracil phosphoribosyltransferase
MDWKTALVASTHEMEEAVEALKEASISIACALDDPEGVTVKDLEHIQNEIAVLEAFVDPFLFTHVYVTPSVAKEH